MMEWEVLDVVVAARAAPLEGEPLPSTPRSCSYPLLAGAAATLY